MKRVRHYRRIVLAMFALQAACVERSVAPAPSPASELQESKEALWGILPDLVTTRYLDIGERLTIANNLGSRGRITLGTWISANTAVVAEDVQGALYGVRAGSTMVRKYSGNIVLDSILIHVGPAGPFVVQPSSISLEVGAEAFPVLSIPTPIVRWTTVDSTIARVSATGTIRAIRSGATKVIALSAFGFTSEVTVNVYNHGPVQAPASVTELPRIALDGMVQSARSAPMLRLLRPRSAAELQAMLDSAKYGDEIRLLEGTTYLGNFVLRKKTPGSNGWITISGGGSRPSAGQRIEPTKQVLSRIEAANALLPAIKTEGAASGYILTGLEVTARAGATTSYMLLALGSGDTDQNASNIPSRILLDRVYVHGAASLDIRRCVALNSDSTAIVDSWISECHSKGLDAQAVGGWNGRGPYLIHNNRLEGSGENLLFGGSDPSITGLIPSDITVTQNYLYKPLAWKGNWLVKNTLEIKSACRVLIEGNVFENNWPDGQVGFSIVLKSVNQSGRAPWSETSNITLVRNLIKDSHSGVSLAGRPEVHEAVPMSRIAFRDNVFLGTALTGRLLEVSGVNDLTFEQNTGFGGQFGFLLHSLGGVNLSVRNNIIGILQSSLSSADMVLGGQAVTPGTAALDRFYPNTWVFEGNVLPGVDQRKFPQNNWFARSILEVGFVDYPAGLELTAGSAFRSMLSNGRPPGANYTEIQAAVAKATNGY